MTLVDGTMTTEEQPSLKPSTRGAAGLWAVALRTSGLIIALVQGLVLPITDRSELISPPLIILAAGMMGLAKAVGSDSKREP